MWLLQGRQIGHAKEGHFHTTTAKSTYYFNQTITGSAATARTLPLKRMPSYRRRPRLRILGQARIRQQQHWHSPWAPRARPPRRDSPSGQRIGNRRLRPESERPIAEVIDVWAARAERLPVFWILEEATRRARARRVQAPSRRAVTSTLRARGLESVSQKRFAERSAAAVALTPRTRQALAIMQMDHTLVPPGRR
jgi:hypothetical protein